MITGYFMCPCRDHENGNHEVKWDNVQFAREIGHAIEYHFPTDIDLFVPHDHEEFVEAVIGCGICDEIIVKAFCAIAVQKDLSICYRGHGISPGMELELEARKGLPNVMVDELNAEAIEQISLAINEIRQCLSGQQ